MLKGSRKHEYRMSEITAALNGPEADAMADADRDALTTELISEGSRFRAALAVEQEAADADPDAGTERHTDPQEREIARLLEKADVADFFDPIAGGRMVEGAAAELRCATLGDTAPGNMMPLDVFLPTPAELQYRVDTATTYGTPVQDNASGIAARLFPVGALDYMGVQRPTVQYGTTSYVQLVSAAVADARLPGVALDAVASTFTVKSLNPSRVVARVNYDSILDARLQGASDALVADLRSQISQKLDLVGLLGQAAVTDVSPALIGIISALPDPTDPTAASTWTDVLDAYDNIDGIAATDDSNVRMLVNLESWRYIRGLQIDTSGSLLRDRLPAGRFRASANMPAGVSDISTALTYAAGEGRGFIQPVWRGVALIRDPYSESSEDRVSVTARVYTAQDLITDTRYKRLEYRTA